MAHQEQPSSACPTCGFDFATAGSGVHGKMCDACNKARIKEINRIADHYDQHPDECCCHTFLPRFCCKAPIHGDWWRVNAIQFGERFCFFIRAKDRTEAMEVGTEACQDNGEECISVTKATEREARAV